jgi:ATP-binding cassette subfamily C protein CydD
MNLDKRLVRETKNARAALLLTIGLGWGAGVATVLQAQYLSRIVSRVFLAGWTLAEAQPLLIALLLVALARAALLWGSEVAAFQVAGRVKTELRERLFAHLMALGPAYTRGERSGELTNTLVEGVEALEAYLSQYLPQLALAALVPVTILFIVFPIDLLSGFVLLITAPLIPLFMVLIGNLADALTRRQWALLSRLSAHFLDVLQGLTTLKMFGRSRDQLAVIARVSDRFRDATMSVLRVAFLSALVLEMVATISTALVAVEVGLRLLYAQLSFEQAFFVLILAPEFYLPLRLLGTRFHAGVSGVTAARRVFEVLEGQTEDEGRKTKADDYSSFVLRPSSIIFDSVHYAYDAGERPALNGISFEMRPGQKVALVGPSGAGKSTVAFLLLRFVEPTQGRIIVGGKDLREMPAATWREQVAWVPQNPYLFNATIAENIALARPAATRAEIVRAAQQAYAHAFIEALPEGYETVVGERGGRLSGGEAQRIALARAFLKNAPLMILDEATANLDPDTEDELQEAIAHLVERRTVLVIAHRLTTVTRADHIVVLNQGRVVERGTHAMLSQQNGLYRELVTTYAGL